MEKLSELFVKENRKIVLKEPISSLSEYLEIIEKIKKAWNINDLWYRGVLNSNYDLFPSIYRKDVWNYDPIRARELLTEFQRKSIFYLKNKLTEWDIYQIMQHYGTPTRLLDWTEGSLIALFFAVEKLEECNIPSVYVLNPYWLNKITTGVPELLYTSGQDKLVDGYLFDDKLKSKFPIAILPPFMDNRILMQRSCFTVHGKFKNGFYKLFLQPESRVLQIRFKNSSIKGIMNQITSCGINYSTIFPDLEGLSMELKHEYSII